MLQPRTDDFEQATILLAEFVTTERIEQQKKATGKEPDSTPLSLVLLRYWEEHGEERPSAESIRNSLTIWNDFYGAALVSDLTPQRQQAFLGWMREKKWSAGYISRILSDGRAALNRAKKFQELTDVPFVFDVARGEPPERALAIDQMARLIDFAGGRKDPGQTAHILMFILVGLSTAARPDALLDLTRAQCNFESRRIDLNGWAADGAPRPQTKKYRAVVPMTDFIRPWLLKAKPRVVNYYGRPVASVRKWFQKAQEEPGIPEFTVAKSIRHTVAKELRSRGVDDWEVAGLLGHRKPGRSTTEIYAKYDPAYLGNARRELDGYLRELAEKTTVEIALDAPSVPVA